MRIAALRQGWRLTQLLQRKKRRREKPLFVKQFACDIADTPFPSTKALRLPWN